MWENATKILIACLFLSIVGTEILRSIMHNKREEKKAHASTLDIALYGTIIVYFCILGVTVSGILWFITNLK